MELLESFAEYHGNALVKLWQDPTGGCEDLPRQTRTFAKFDHVIVHTKEVSDAAVFTLI